MRVFKQRAFAKANFALLLKWNPRTYFPPSSPRCRNAGLPPPQPSHFPWTAPATERKQNNTKLSHARAALGDPVRHKSLIWCPQLPRIITRVQRHEFGWASVPANNAGKIALEELE
jgi:hypothetical protein